MVACPYNIETVVYEIGRRPKIFTSVAWNVTMTITWSAILALNRTDIFFATMIQEIVDKVIMPNIANGHLITVIQIPQTFTCCPL
jgi:hypothetical protein